MNFSEDSRKNKIRLSDITSEPRAYKTIACILWVIFSAIVINQLFLWNHFNESKELHKEWYTDKSEQFKILPKLQTRSSESSDNLIFLLQNTKTGQKLTLNVTAKCYLDHDKGDKVWFTVHKAQYYESKNIPSVISGWLIAFCLFLPIILWILWGVQEFTGEDSYDKWRNYIAGHNGVNPSGYIFKYKLIMNLPMFIGFPIAIISPLLYAILY